MNDQNFTVGRRKKERALGPLSERAAFTLIELLVVIAIIGVLAALTMGLTRIVGVKNKESRMTGALQELVSRIDAYYGALGQYPPDNPLATGTNQLYYELSGAVFTNEQFTTLNRRETISAAMFQQIFNTDGIYNSARQVEDIKYRPHEDFTEGKDYAELIVSPDVDILVAPVAGPNPIGTKKLNPWHYDSSSPTNNTQSFDLWADVVIGDRVMRFNNWGPAIVLEVQ